VADYLDFEIEDDPDVLAQLGYDEMASRLPGWDPIPGEIDTVLIQAVARIASQVRASAGIVPVGIFRYLSSQIGLLPISSQPAHATTTITATDTAGHLIPAGTQFAITNGAGELRTFETILDATIPPAASTVALVTMQSSEDGVYDNGIVSGTTLAPIDSLGFIASAVLTQTTFGGVDVEDDQAFLARMNRRFQLMSVAPVLAVDFAAMALDVLPVGCRAVAVDDTSYIAGSYSSPVAKSIVVFAVDATGAQISAPQKAAVLAYLNSLREANFSIYMGDTTYTQVSVKFVAHALPGYVAATVQAAALAAVTAYISPANWATPAFEALSGMTMAEGWNLLRLGELYQVINDVEGIAYVDSVNLVAGASAPTTQTADVTIFTPLFSLATPGSVTGTVT
jgi:hypothetical protein